MAKYKTLYYETRTGKLTEGPTVNHPNPPIDQSLVKKSKVVTVVRDSEGEDHPANAGKFFLYRIVK